MHPIINHHYTIFYKPLYHFDFVKYNPIVDESEYNQRITPHLQRIIEHLKDNSKSRQEVIVTNDMYNNACLISLQFQIVNNKLIVIANFRSQCEVNGRPYDSMMLRYFATLVSQGLSLNKFIIYVNVGNYHINKGVV